MARSQGPLQRWLRVLTSAAVFVAGAAAPAGASGQGSQLPTPTGIRCLPEVEGPVPFTDESPPYRPPGVAGPPRGDIDEEFLVTCDAAGVRYTTTVYVRRPARTTRQSGTVVVEPTHPANLWPVQQTTDQYVAHADHVTVAVHSSALVVESLVKPANPQRYQRLSLPDLPGIESEILAQVGALLKTSGLPGVHADHVILGGYSNTAARVRTYIAEQHDRARLDHGAPVYDGYFPGQTAVGTFPGPVPDTDVPVIELQGEREVIQTLARNPGGLTYRRPDGRNYRLYEVPGMAHLNTRDPETLLFPPRWCGITNPSRFPLEHVWANALDNLVRWVDRGIPAPRARRIELEADGATVRRDQHGNARGGTPAPYIEVPVATYLTVSVQDPTFPTVPCDMIGPQIDFSPEKLTALYGTHGGYVRQFNRRLTQLVRDDWYLHLHASELRVEAASFRWADS